LQDTTGFSVPSERGVRAELYLQIADAPFARVHSDDESLACLLIAQWELLTRRTLRADVPPHMISADELIEFWADAQMVSGQLQTWPPHPQNG
jgi:hypothetical protein